MNNKNSKTIWMIITLVVFLLGVFFLIHAFKDIGRRGLFSRPISQNFHKKKIKVDDVQIWMTFGFLNRAFSLPPEYLKDGLDITNKRYPNVTIDRWAKDSQENPNVALDKVKKMIRDFPGSPGLDLPKNPASI